MAKRSTSQRYRPLAWLLALALGALWSCSTPEKQYEVLNFFFDGVPLPASMRPDIGDAGDGTVALVVVQHPPYAQDRCTECHGGIGKFSMSLQSYSGLKADVCLKCHENKHAEHRAMHGPVASMECLACHDPHSSRYPHLLVAPTPGLCLKCHFPEDLQLSALPEHEDLETDCLNCHLGHGGDDPNFLRALLIAPPNPNPEPEPEPNPEPSADTAPVIEGGP